MRAVRALHPGRASGQGPRAEALRRHGARVVLSRHVESARELYRAFAAADRDAAEALLADDFEFSSPPDPQLDRAGYFERCWPGAGSIREFELVRLLEDGDEVVVTYEATRADGTRFRNTEVLTFTGGDRVRRAEVYFGWDL